MIESLDVRTMPAYGVDAPGVVRGFLVGGTICAVAAALASAALPIPWNLATIPLVVAAIGLLLLGGSMLLYSFHGKHRLRDHLLRQIRWRGDEVVLDVGAGRGLMTVGAAQRAPNGQVLALDVWSARDLTGNTPDALRRNAAVERVIGRIEVIEGDARKLNLADASIDVVVSVFCLHNIEAAAGRDAACREIARVLKPGGIALIADFPGTAAYVQVLRAAGLTLAGPLRAERMALGIAGYLVATKITTAELAATA